jgi:hypothetical protein
MTLQKSRAIPTLMSVAAALVIFLPMTVAAQTLESNDPSASAASPQVIAFSDGADDFSFRMTSDATGNFYIASTISNGPNSFAVLKYSVDGKLLGVFRFKFDAGISVDVKVDAGGNIYAGGSGGAGGAIVSFSPSGKLRWSHMLGDSVTALALDPSGDVYVGGTSDQTSMFVAKYTADGSLLWQTAHQGSTPVLCGAAGLTPGSCLIDMRLDHNGNVIVFGYSTNAGPNVDSTTLKIDPQGNLLWAQNFTQQSQFNKVPAAGAVDPNDGIYSTGQGVDPLTGQRFPYTVKYDTNGNQIFASTGAGTGGSSIAVDVDGNILLSGFTLVEGEDAVTVSKIEPSGKQIFVTQIPTGGKVVNDSKGNIFVSGEDGSNDYVVNSLSPTGKLLSTFIFATQGVNGTVSDSIVDPFGNLLVTGYLLSNAKGFPEILTLKFPTGFKSNATE